MVGFRVEGRPRLAAAFFGLGWERYLLLSFGLKEKQINGSGSLLFFWNLLHSCCLLASIALGQKVKQIKEPEKSKNMHCVPLFLCSIWG